METQELPEAFPMRPRRKKFTPVVIDEIPQLVDEGKSPEEIARRIGCTVSTLRVRCSQFKISLRRARKNRTQKPRAAKVTPRSHLVVRISRHAIEALRVQATSEGMSDSQLATALLEAIARDGLYKAVLDRE